MARGSLADLPALMVGGALAAVPVLGKRIMARKFEPLGNVGVTSQHCCELVDRMLQINPADRPTAPELVAVARVAAAALQGA